MDKHFNKYNHKKIGLCCWFGKIPEYVIELIKRNSEYFDELYFVTNPENTITIKGVKVIKMPRKSATDYLGFSYYWDKISALGPAATSDMLFYFPKKFLGICSKIFDFEFNPDNRVMYFDANMLLWSQGLINQLFNRIDLDKKLFIKKNQNHYLDGNSSGYYSSNFSVDDKNIEDDADMKSILREFLENHYTDRYTLLGPTFLNGYWNHLNSSLILKDEGLLKSAEIDMNNIHPKLYTYEQKDYPMSIGFTISHTLVRSAGFKISDIKLFNDGDGLAIQYERL